MEYTEFGLEVRTELLKQGKSLTWLAKQLPCSQGFLSDMLKGNRNLVSNQTNWIDLIRGALYDERSKNSNS